MENIIAAFDFVDTLAVKQPSDLELLRLCLEKRDEN
jgi:hypothetical protein